MKIFIFFLSIFLGFGIYYNVLRLNLYNDLEKNHRIQTFIVKKMFCNHRRGSKIIIIGKHGEQTIEVPYKICLNCYNEKNIELYYDNKTNNIFYKNENRGIIRLIFVFTITFFISLFFHLKNIKHD